MKKSNPYNFCRERFKEAPIIGIMRNIALEDVKNILPLYVESGLTTMEITMNSEGADEIIKYAVEEYGDCLNVGAGTVCNMNDLKRALNAGAQFIVTPIVNKKIIKRCVSKKIPVFPGAFTPTEVYKAWSLGAEMVKVFPAEILGSKYFKEILAPLNHIDLLATGGISLEKMDDYFDVGVRGLGIGSPLFLRKNIAEKDWESLSKHFNCFVKKLKVFKSRDNNED